MRVEPRVSKPLFDYLVFAVPLLITFSLRCGIDSVAGNGTQTGNPAVVGVLYQPDGKTPASGVRVFIRPKNALADTGQGLTKRVADTASVVTDGSGRYAFDSTLDSGTYVIEAASGNNAVLIDSVAVTAQDSTDSLPPDTLKPAGALKGVIKLTEGGDPRKVFILAFGIDRFARVEADGRFKFQNLAEAAYSLRIISSLDDYGVLDTVGVPVRSADTTNLDTIELPFTGIPTPRGLTISYDTLRQIMTLRWYKADTSLISGYHVYRRNVDSNSTFARVNSSLVRDTAYVDSTVEQGFTYEYQLKAVDKSANEGKFSNAVIVIVAPSFQYISKFGVQGSNNGEFNEPGEMAFDSSGNVYVLDPFNTQGKIHKFRPDGSLDTTWVAGQFDELRDIEISHDTIFVLDRKNKRMKLFSTNGDSLSLWSITAASDPISLTIHNGFCYIGDRSLNQILKYSTIGDSTSSWTTIGSYRLGAIKSIAARMTNRSLYILDSDSIGLIVDTAGNMVSRFTIEPRARVTAYIQWILLANGSLMYPGSNVQKVFVIDTAGQLLAQFGSQGTADGLFNYPSAVGESPDHRYLVSDSQNHRIQVFR